MANTKAQACIQWIKDYYKDNPDGKAIIGISGGKDSTIAAALCVEALGADRVIGVLMPNGHQADIADSAEVCGILGIEHITVNIGNAFASICEKVGESLWMYGGAYKAENHPMIKTNLPARLRMATLYAVAAVFPNSRVVNTCNRSEDYVGYSTKYGDAAGDFSPLGNLTVREVLEIGDELGLPEYLVHKAPSDGMCGKTDEDNLGFTYDELDNHILGTGRVREETKAKIERLHKATRHKYRPMPMFDPEEAMNNELDQLDIDDINVVTYAEGGLVTPGQTMANLCADISAAAANNANFNVEPINYGEINLNEISEIINKVIETAGYAFKGGK